MKRFACALLTIAFIVGVTVAQEKAPVPENKAATDTTKTACCGMKDAKGHAKECCPEGKHGKDGKCCAKMKQAKAPKAEKPKSSEPVKKQEPKAPEPK